MSLISRIFPSLAQDFNRSLFELEPFFLQSSRAARFPNFPTASSVLNGYIHPSVDVSETDKNYIIEAEIEKSNVRGDDQLRTVDTTQSGETKAATTSEVVESGREGTSIAEPTYWTSERVLGSFQRSFTLPNNADKENVKAQYKDGILSILIPKVERQSQKITIE
ncbi:15890_t:CDS:2 [Dentiscutata erythropus]|uniref:15890_t:CDS:1 n=1 Tax=Dentiscutata erythropus TaxID=1348616 RepID=A0A9N8W037_9GLOM|nr:15890_t:CDS:2 [Dentiscutata erythropus]